MRATHWLLALTLPLSLTVTACGDKDSGDTGGSTWGDGGTTDGGTTDGGTTDGGTTDGGGTDGGSPDGGSPDGGSPDGGSTDGGSPDGGAGDGGMGDGGAGDGGSGDGGFGDGGAPEPVNLLTNPNFESGFDGWAVYPESLTNYSIVSTGDEIYGSKDTFTAYEGTGSLKVWGQYTGWENETPIYQSFDVKPGQVYVLHGWMYQHPDDAIVGDQTYAALAIKFFTADYSGFDMQESVHFVSTTDAGTWTELTASGKVPDGFTIGQAAVEFWHCTGEVEGDCYDGGAIYVDDLNFYLVE